MGRSGGGADGVRQSRRQGEHDGLPGTAGSGAAAGPRQVSGGGRGQPQKAAVAARAGPAARQRTSHSCSSSTDSVSQGLGSLEACCCARVCSRAARDRRGAATRRQPAARTGWAVPSRALVLQATTVMAAGACGREGAWLRPSREQGGVAARPRGGTCTGIAFWTPMWPRHAPPAAPVAQQHRRPARSPQANKNSSAAVPTALRNTCCCTEQQCWGYEWLGGEGRAVPLAGGGRQFAWLGIPSLPIGDRETIRACQPCLAPQSQTCGRSTCTASLAWSGRLSPPASLHQELCWVPAWRLPVLSVSLESPPRHGSFSAPQPALIAIACASHSHRATAAGSLSPPVLPPPPPAAARLHLPTPWPQPFPLSAGQGHPRCAGHGRQCAAGAGVAASACCIAHRRRHQACLPQQARRADRRRPAGNSVRARRRQGPAPPGPRA